MKLFSASTLGFYDFTIHTDIPSDAVEITDDLWQELLEGQAEGKRITADEKGFPELTDLPPLTQQQLTEQAEKLKQALKNEADAEIAWRQDAVDAGIETDKEARELTNWKKYRVLLMRVDIATAPDISWPVRPV
ncbi:tail fiber assembly protein [Escherichia coli]|uniref:tail fiber assembly protein n=1 Tax=Escherichia coli TaxID=562 RepID=UPI0020C9E124|nr:tail fiber assembly protein [Escherichia coli]EIH4402674.1 tail fiber assembly protein [Escherichia coli]UTP17191.1 tail fiber assembly protein [Escherichia coli]HCO7567832.1 tail fiber assembly protein [Escherichia coli]HCO7576845.1 tail fiber assembly protein [Escherichia coli]HDQ1256409.1 tail fiber assembly protein [Escherichia coli]